VDYTLLKRCSISAIGDCKELYVASLWDGNFIDVHDQYSGTHTRCILCQRPSSRPTSSIVEESKETPGRDKPWAAVLAFPKGSDRDSLPQLQSISPSLQLGKVIIDSERCRQIVANTAFWIARVIIGLEVTLWWRR
jgi:hypothetical protein